MSRRLFDIRESAHFADYAEIHTPMVQRPRKASWQGELAFFAMVLAVAVLFWYEVAKG